MSAIRTERDGKAMRVAMDRFEQMDGKRMKWSI